MTNVQFNTLRPGLLVSVRTSISGNVKYDRKDIEAEHVTTDGKKQARWETERVIDDPIEHEASGKCRDAALSTIKRLCAKSSFGYLCPEADLEPLQAAIAEARRLAEDFNKTALLTRISINVLIGRIAPDDVEAVKAINSEVRELLSDMETGLRNLDVKTVRDAATKAKNIGQMLSPDAAARIQIAIDTARSAAKRIVSAGETASVEIDLVAIRKIDEARTVFLDLDEAQEIAEPVVDGRAVDFEPVTPLGGVVGSTVATAAELEF